MFRFKHKESNKELVVGIATRLVKWIGMESPEYDVRIELYGPSLPGNDENDHEACVFVRVKDKTWKYVDSGYKNLQYFPLFNIRNRKIGVAYHYTDSHSGGIRVKYSVHGIDSSDDTNLKRRAVLAIVAIKGLLNDPDNFVI